MFKMNQEGLPISVRLWFLGLGVEGEFPGHGFEGGVMLTFNFLSSLELVQKVLVGCSRMGGLGWVVMVVCKPILVLGFGPNQAFWLGLSPGPSKTINFMLHNYLCGAHNGFSCLDCSHPSTFTICFPPLPHPILPSLAQAPAPAGLS